MGLNNMHWSKDEVKRRFGDLLEISTTQHRDNELVFKTYFNDKALCVRWYMGQYLDRTKNLRGSENRFFISMKKPHSKVGWYTIRRWTKMGLRLSGIDLNICNAHSTRSAATSKAVSKGYPCEPFWKLPDGDGQLPLLDSTTKKSWKRKTWHAF